ncbi:MAG: GNAT family N-acetyltransferase [SAR202 cluster bacterium]|nr:GNAT family N-acetyltransferase [SAR202 cluster bacterium]
MNKRSPDLRIRNARPEELDEVAEVLKAAYQQYEPSVPAAAWEPYFEDIADVRSRLADSELIVAEREGRIVGSVTFYPPSDSADHGWPSGWAGIRLLAVLPDTRGLGIGRVLMEECFRRCRDLGVRTVGLHTTKIMAVARAMYERMGFVRVPGYDFHPAPGVVVMGYRLDL